MADALVQMLNSYGYQPVFLPRTGMVPPDLYNFANHRLVRRGPLTGYFQKPVTFKPTSGKMADLEGKVTSGKHFEAAIGFLQNALAALGISGLPKLDLSFTGSKEFAFSFADVTYQTIDPSMIDPILQDLNTPLAIPDAYVEMGGLHIAYEYVYSNKLTMSRSDGQQFQSDISGNVANYIDLGAKGQVTAQGNSTVTFSGANNEVVAFAYKAGQLHRNENRWTFEPEVVLRAADGVEMSKPFLPVRGVVLIAEEAEAASPQH
jgi:hypothetical protein